MRARSLRRSSRAGDLHRAAEQSPALVSARDRSRGKRIVQPTAIWRSHSFGRTYPSSSRSGTKAIATR